jgi:chromate transporter
VLHVAGYRADAGNDAVHNARPGPEHAMPEWTKPSMGRLFSTLIVWLAFWFGPLVLLYAALGGGHVFVAEANFFSKMATITFGDAYAVLAYVAQ